MSKYSIIVKRMRLTPKYASRQFAQICEKKFSRYYISVENCGKQKKVFYGETSRCRNSKEIDLYVTSPSFSKLKVALKTIECNDPAMT